MPWNLVNPGKPNPMVKEIRRKRNLSPRQCVTRNAATLSSMFPGHADPQATADYRARFPLLCDAGHFRRAQQVPGAGKLWLSSIGVGTYLGEPDDRTDEEYSKAIATALRSGLNVLDTAINYRHQRSERTIGAALKQLIELGELNRNQVLIATKAGYLSFDTNLPPHPRAYIIEEYVEPGILDPSQIVGGVHAMAPAYLENQIERSRRNLGIETIDVFYLHNPETQLSEVPRELFLRRLGDAFARLEQQVQAGKLCYYGLATWSGFRLPPGSRDFLDLEEIVERAEEVRGHEHHLRFVQLPFNLTMPEAYTMANQGSGKKQSLLAAAAELGIAVVGSATLHQGQLTDGLPKSLGELLGSKSDAENAIQFSRSAPGLTTALVGMGHEEHVLANLKVAQTPPTTLARWNELFQATFFPGDD
ncbi:MAG TPA: aldo/keto reductase [Terriglobales bacterium]|nr:aldo/keto reductase [Terriglobales bacterium]